MVDMGRKRIERTAEEERVLAERRREQKRAYARRQRAAVKANRASVDEATSASTEALLASLGVTREELRRERQREYKRRHRAAAKERRSQGAGEDDPQCVRYERELASDRERKRERRQNATTETRAVGAQRKRKARCVAADEEYATETEKKPLEHVTGATARFQRQFANNPFGHTCDVDGRLWFQSDLSGLDAVRDEAQRVCTDSRVTTTIKTEPEESVASDEEPYSPAVAIKKEPPDIQVSPTENAREDNEILGITGIETLVTAARCQSKEELKSKSRMSEEETRSTCLASHRDAPKSSREHQSRLLCGTLGSVKQELCL